MRMLTLAFVLLASVASAQPGPLPVDYRITRTLPLPVASSTFLASAMTCNLPPGAFTVPVGLRITDPNNPQRECEIAGTLGGVLLPRVAGTVYAYSLAAGNGQNEWSPETTAPNISVPAAPVGPRVKPGNAPGVIADGVVLDRFPYAGLDVARVLIDGTTLDVHVGALTLTLPGYSVAKGDRLSLAFWRP